MIFSVNKGVPLYLIFFFLSSLINAQSGSGVIKGRVLEKATGKPLEYVNVYISGTTLGTATNKDGDFIISNLPSGTHDVVASIIGYRPNTITVHLSEGQSKKIVFNLEEVSYELESVLISEETPDEWKDNLQIFKERFFGESEFEINCTLENPQYLNFEWINKSELKAYSEVPLIVTNHTLGYEISFILVDFIWNTETRHLKLVVLPSFKELKDSTGTLKNIWAYNRKKAYEGSLDCFLRSIVNNNYKENGFQIYMDNTANIEKNNLHHPEKPLIKMDGPNYILSFRDFLKVAYLFNNPSHPEVSWIKLSYMQATLDGNGYPKERLPFQVYGSWAEKGVSTMLPKYYSPDTRF